MMHRVKPLLLAALDQLPDKFRRRLFLALASELHVSMVEIQGAMGAITGYLEDWVFGQYIRTGSWSGEITEITSGVLRRARGGTFLDIGANIGLTLIPVAQIPSTDCLAFEPEPRNFTLLERNLKRNCPNSAARLFRVALFDTDGTVKFELSSSNFGDHRVRNRSAPPSTVFHEDDRRVISIPSRRLDGIVHASSLADPVVIKLDTQGAEQHIYAGGTAVFAKAELLSIEYWPYGITRMGGDPEELIKSLERDYRYGCFLEKGRATLRGDLVGIGTIAARLRQLAERKQITREDINTHDVVLTKDRSTFAN